MLYLQCVLMTCVSKLYGSFFDLLVVCHLRNQYTLLNLTYIISTLLHVSQPSTDWMLASVSNQTVSTNNGQTNIDVPKNNTEGRFPGLRPMVISNDKMRDHKMELLEERAFRRWCCSHIVNYNFTEFIENQWEEREISFHADDLFSDEIQGNECGGDDDEGGKHRASRRNYH